ncbi:MAG TPA: hypothetical protein VF670_06985 [Duganella sp.]|jgi:hypothetical protein
MATKSKEVSQAENPGADDSAAGQSGAPAGGGAAASGPEDPDDSSAGLDAPNYDDELQAIYLAAGVSDDLLALRDAVETMLLAASGESAALADAPSANGIVGVGIGISDPHSIAIGAGMPGEPTLTVYTESALPQEELARRLAQVAGARALSSIPIRQIPVGVIEAYAHSHSDRHRPAPGGVSVAHFDVTAGTIGSRAIGLTLPWNNRHLILSNNHVLANTNAGRINDSIVQPGPYDGGQRPGDQIAVLARWVPIRFGGVVNYVDAAFGWAWADRVRGEQFYLSGGAPAYYRTGTLPLAASVGLLVGKSGRTTGLTQGRVVEIGVSINVRYSSGNVALFRNQIAIESVDASPFAAGGDSGSLIWHWATGVRPVGLLFAGGGGRTYANPIGSVLAALNIRLLP